MATQTTGLIAERYASALYELADELKALDQVAADLKAIRAMMASSADLMRLIRSPVLGRSEQAKAVSALAEKAGFSALTGRFLGTLASNRRLFALASVIDAFLAELARRRGEATADVTSAVALTPAQTQALEEALKSVVGSKVSVDLKVDQSLIGGIVVRVGSRMIDTSLATKLRRLRLAMKGVG
ncbi:MAG: F0F1 ATP synthase subunit delta [Hyphomicrobiaceae bacterium]|nr:F0F1 ATP synthase subunit delta [Hyphomicrobiaceae bacterium]